MAIQVGSLRTYFINVADKKEYTNFLVALSNLNTIDRILKNQTFICRKCGSFSVPTKSMNPTLKKIREKSILAEELYEITDIEPWYFDLVDQPNEVVEKLV